MRVKLIVEGGGDKKLLDSQFRRAWTQFFRAAGLDDRMPGIVRGKGRSRAYGLFVTAVNNPIPGVLPLLLVDSEAPVSRPAQGSLSDVDYAKALDAAAWGHLKARDNFTKPTAAGDRQAFLMVQLMETWFLVDRDLLTRYFGQHFRDHKIPQWQDLEAAPKERVYEALENATAACHKRFDHNRKKGKITFELLEELDPRRVEAACPHAADLLSRLRTV